MSASLDCAAILAADMRQLADDIAAGRAIVGQSVWRSYADRVEKIGAGNIAKLRNALELSKVAILVAKEKMDLENPVILEIIDEALAAPTSNCAVGTPEEQAERFRAYCEAHKDHDAECLYCPLFGKTGGHCELVWAQMPYESGAAK